MTEKFVTPTELPTPHEREILIILMEECAEIIQRASKLLRFGATEIQPGQSLTNTQRLAREVGDLNEVLRSLEELKLMPWSEVAKGWDQKRRQLDIYLQTNKDTPER
jgi:hypothetical protein